MSMMKRLFILTLTALLSLSVVACDDDEAGDEEESEASDEDSEDEDEASGDEDEASGDEDEASEAGEATASGDLEEACNAVCEIEAECEGEDLDECVDECLSDVDGESDECKEAGVVAINCMTDEFESCDQDFFELFMACESEFEAVEEECEDI